MISTQLENIRNKSSKRNLVTATLPHAHVKPQVSHEATQVLLERQAEKTKMLQNCN